MEADVWVSGAIIDSRLSYDINAIDYDSKRDRPMHRALREGFSQTSEQVPSDFFHRYPIGDELTPPKYLFRAGGLLAIDARCASVIRSFDIGDGQLHPINIYQRDKKTRVPGNYFLLNFGARKEAFVSEQSPRAMHQKLIDKWSIFVMDTPLNEYACTLSRKALEGADIWADPKVFSSIFFSRRLVLALKAAGLEQRFDFRACQVISSNEACSGALRVR